MASAHDGHRERLRNQYAERGADGFLDHQLLELLLTYCIPRKDTNLLAHALLERFGSLENVFRADLAQLESVEGIGSSTALFLHMQWDVMRVVQRRRLEDKQGRIRLNTPLASARFAAGVLGNEPYENVCVACLNKSLVLQRTKVIQSGSLVEAPVYPRLAAETALLYRAHSVILVHNHPSGNVAPSQEDCNATLTVRAALQSIEVSLLDHLIVGGQDVYSFSANMVIRLSGAMATTITLDEYLAQLAAEASPSVVVRESYLQEPYFLMQQAEATLREPN